MAKVRHTGGVYRAEVARSDDTESQIAPQQNPVEAASIPPS
jgi:hypothetical protein